MSKISVFLCFALALCSFACQPTNNEQALPTVGQRVDNFGLYDHTGDFHQLYYYSDADAIVLYIQGNACPIVRNGLQDLKDIRDRFEGQNVVFFMLNANLQDDRESIAKEAAEFGIDMPILVDDNQLVAEAMEVQRTAEAIVIDPKRWNVAYRGPVNDRLGYESQRPEATKNYLADALGAVLANEEIAEPVVAGKGCLVALLDNDAEAHAAISYTEDITPILTNTCLKCHYEGGIGPWAMDSYETVKGWSPMIREVLRTRRMPPWQADPHFGTFKNDLSLDNEEITTLVHWIEAGAPRGEGEDPLKSIAPPESEWTIGKPDLEIAIAPQKIPATGVLDYRYDEYKLELDRDMWATALEFLPGDRKALHHVLVNVQYPKGITPPLEDPIEWLDGIFAGYAPGMEAEHFPAGTGRYLPKGATLVFQLHYTTYGKETMDETRMGIHLSPVPPDKEFLIVGPFHGEIEIPPHDKRYAVAAEKVFDREISLYGFLPHMHFRGKSFRYTAQFPDGRKEVLLNVPNYNFNWQRFYLLEEPLVLPANSKVICEATFDNSGQNSFNPDPAKTVYWGDQSFNEMMIGYMSFHYGKPVSETLGMN